MTTTNTEPKRRTAETIVYLFSKHCLAMNFVMSTIQKEWLEQEIKQAMAQARLEALEEAAHTAELCGVDNDGHYAANKIRALMEKGK